MLLLGFIIIAAFATFFGIVYYSKYVILKNDVQETWTSNRIGFKDQNWNDCQIEVEELEKFKNGYSRLKIRKITYFGTSTIAEKSYKDSIRDQFTEIQQTDSWTWLERDESLMEVRTKKFSRILKNLS